MGRFRSTAVALFVSAAVAPRLNAQIPRTPGNPGDTVLVVPGALYAAGSFRRFLLGSHYRNLWTTPIRVPVLDLRTWAGGLEPVRSHVGSQTTSLRFTGRDGRTYQFRSVFKTPAAGLRPDLQGTVIADILQDGASASHPVGALVVEPLLAAAGVLHAPPSLFVMPDDPALGEFRADFAGILGWIEERPDEADDEGRGGFGVALRVISPDRLYERVDEGPRDQVDVHAFLVARLIDILIGDRDRHRDNWRWALLDDGSPVRFWEPISRDHDEAFVKLDGLALGFARRHYPQLTSFDDEYDNTLNLNWHSREIDRRFLVGLDRAQWDSTATWLQGRLTDDVIRQAVHRLPPAMYAAGGPALERALIARRDHLGQEVGRYYALLADQVEVHATNDAEIAEIVRVDDRYVDVRIRGENFGEPWFHRRFDAKETSELRIAMWGGADRVIVRGNGDSPIRIRVIGGQGRDTFVDSSASGGIHFYDSGDATEVQASRPLHVNRKPYPEWIGSDTVRYPPRDWGSWTRWVPSFSAGPDFGALIGIGIQRTTYGFRRQPWATDLSIRGGIATGSGWGSLDLDAVVRRENSNVRWEFNLSASGIDRLRFYGFGNATTADGPDTFYKAELDRFGATVRLVLPLSPQAEFRIGPMVRRTSSAQIDDASFFAAIRDTLYGAGAWLEAGAAAGLTIDLRDRANATTRGFLLDVSGQVFPAVADVASAFEAFDAEARFYVTPGQGAHSPTLAVRAEAQKILGDYPFHEAAWLGGRNTLRGWPTERFAGDAALSTGIEYRQPVGRFALVLPGDLGFFGLLDAGRVWVEGDSPGGWHTGAGGGLWFAFVDRATTFSISLAASRERTAFYAGLGFGF
jgi:Omp85 superfamily domain